MEQLPGFVAQEESGFICKLRRFLYGLKQSPRARFSRFGSGVWHDSKHNRPFCFLSSFIY